jgi:hypothetical protein
MRGGLSRRGAPVNDRLAGAGDDCGYESCGHDSEQPTDHHEHSLRMDGTSLS